MAENFEPFSEEWEDEVMKMNKKDIVLVLKTAGLERLKYQNRTIELQSVSSEMFTWILYQEVWYGPDPQEEWKEIIEPKIK